MKKYKCNRLKVYTNLPEDVELAKTRDNELVAISDSPLGLKRFVDTNDFTKFTVSDTNEEFPYVSLSCGGCFSSIIFKSDLEEIEEAPKYREFKNDLEFFENIGHIGEVITFRFKVTTTKYKDTYYKEVISQIRYIGDKVYIKLHDTWFTLETLFKELEICLKGEWKPFGIMD